MAEVTIMVGARFYRIACDDGQESHLNRLARDLDERVDALKERFGEVGDARLAIFAALQIIDERDEARRRVSELEVELASVRAVSPGPGGRADQVKVEVSYALNAAAERVDRAAESLRRAQGAEALEVRAESA